MSNNTVNIVITNSHSDNRGDEAAQRAMINTLGKLIPNSKLTVVTASPCGLGLQEGVDVFKFAAYSRQFPFFSLPFVFLWLVFKLFGIELSSFFPKFEVFKALKSTSNADIIISAPGGPYFGDLYRMHEISEHLLNIFLARLFKKPVIIYGPSMGPFKIRWRNVLRRYLLNKVEIITLRDPVSRGYLSDLKVTKPVVYVTADSAFQDSINIDRAKIDDIMASEGVVGAAGRGTGRKALIGITPAGIRCNYRDCAEPEKEQGRYNELIARTIDYVVKKFDATVVFVPQLYGRSNDMPLIERIIELVEAKDSVRVLSKKWNSEIQQAIISQMDMVVGNRYHSVIFALKSAVPTVCIAYEHKSVGVMKVVGMEKFLINIKELTYEKLIDKIEQAWDERRNIKDLLGLQVEIQKNRSFMNSVLTKALVNCMLANNTQKDQLEKEIDILIHQFKLESLYASEKDKHQNKTIHSWNSA